MIYQSETLDNDDDDGGGSDDVDDEDCKFSPFVSEPSTSKGAGIQPCLDYHPIIQPFFSSCLNFSGL